MAKNQMTRLDRSPSAINNKFHHFYEAIKKDPGRLFYYHWGFFAWDGGDWRAWTQDVLGNLRRSLLSCARATA